MIVSKIRGGLGNQLFTYAAGRALSSKHNCPLVLDTSWYKNGNRPLMLDHFNIEGEITDEDQSGAEDGIGYNQEHWNYYLGFEKFDGYRFLSGWWQSERFFESAATLVREDLAFRDKSVRERAARLFKQHLEGRGTPPVISIHCRRGDYVELQKKGLYTLPGPAYYRRSMSMFPENCTFALFSDDLPWCKEHLSNSRTIMIEETDALLSFAMMQLCDHHIIANSSFSWWAAWLGETPGKIIVAPEASQWFGPGRFKGYDVHDILPARWRKFPIDA